MRKGAGGREREIERWRMEKGQKMWQRAKRIASREIDDDNARPRSYASLLHWWETSTRFNHFQATKKRKWWRKKHIKLGGDGAQNSWIHVHIIRTDIYVVLQYISFYFNYKTIGITITQHGKRELLAFAFFLRSCFWLNKLTMYGIAFITTAIF